MHVKKFMLW